MAVTFKCVFLVICCTGMLQATPIDKEIESEIETIQNLLSDSNGIQVTSTEISKDSIDTDAPSTSTTSLTFSTTVMSTTNSTTEVTQTDSTTTSSTTTPPLSTTKATTTETSFVPTTPSVSHPIPGWGLALICLAVAAVLFIAGWLFFLRYRRSKIPLAVPVKSIFRRETEKRKTLDSAILVKMFEATFRERSIRGEIAKEFEKVQEFSAALNMMKTREAGQAEINCNRNRFIDIIPFDDNYVSLSREQGIPPSTYINASYLDNMDVLDKIIVTQGPKQNTVLDFWRMVIDKKCRHIIMLTNCQEQGRVKCFQYWPPSGQMLHFDDVSLFTADETEIHPGLLIRKIEVTVEDEEGQAASVHEVRQLHLSSWPDHGVPEHVESVLAFVRVAANFRDADYSVVHCSAGVGRTGEAITLPVLRTINDILILAGVKKLILCNIHFPFRNLLGPPFPD